MKLQQASGAPATRSPPSISPNDCLAFRLPPVTRPRPQAFFGGAASFPGIEWVSREHTAWRGPRVLPIYFMEAGDRQENSSLKKPLLPKWALESRATATIQVVDLVTADSKVQMSPHSYSFLWHVILCGKASSVLFATWVGKTKRTLNTTVYTSLSCPQVTITFHSCLLLISLVCLNYLTLLQTSTLGLISRRVENLYSKR